MSDPDDLWQWRSETRADRTVVTLAGELDMSSAGELRDRLAAVIRPVPIVDIDLGGLTFIDSTILSVFIAAHRDATSAGGSLTVLNPTGHVRRVLAVTGVLPLLGPDDEPRAVRAHG